MIEYLGRNDHQVKVRGFRIELGDIEAQIEQQAGVKEAIVIASNQQGEAKLIAYVVPQVDLPPDSIPTAERLRAELSQVLPEYMIPSAFVSLNRFPLTHNGKLDRASLPSPDLAAFAGQAYEAPRGDIEETLAGIWQSLLQVESVGRRDNFFDLGGHSLLATQLIVRIESAMSLDLPITDLFRYPTLMQLAARLEAVRSAQAEEILITAEDNLEEVLSLVESMSETEVVRRMQQLQNRQQA